MSDLAKLSGEDDLLIEAERWAREGRGVALATVIETWGSAPRPVGAHLVIDEAGNFLGSVSGGCVESAVIEEGIAVIRSGQGKLLTFGVADEVAWRAGLSCGGRISVHVTPINAQIEALTGLNAARKARQAAALVTHLETGALSLAAPEEAGLQEAFRTQKSQLSEDGARFIFVQVPGVRLVVIGAVHISQALVPMARLLGLPVTIIDPRSGFASPERFPEVSVLAEWPEDVFARAPLDRFCAVIALTHDPKIDDSAIRAALAADCFYVGALGSRKSHANRLQRLADCGAAAQRIRAPIGLDIGALSPAEIALSVVAQVIETLRKGAA